MHCTLFSFGKKRHSTEVNFRSHMWGTQDNVATTNVLRNNVLPKHFWERKAFRWFKVETLLWQLACSDCSLPTCLTNTCKNFWEQLCGGTALGGCVTSTKICNQTQSNPEQWQSWLQMFFFFFFLNKPPGFLHLGELLSLHKLGNAEWSLCVCFLGVD